jgi:hypothetical protein
VHQHGERLAATHRATFDWRPGDLAVEAQIAADAGRNQTGQFTVFLLEESLTSVFCEAIDCDFDAALPVTACEWSAPSLVLEVDSELP